MPAIFTLFLVTAVATATALQPPESYAYVSDTHLLRGGNTESEVESHVSRQLVCPNSAPDCTKAVANPSIIWPPNHKFVGVNIEGVTDLNNDELTIKVTHIFQNELLNEQGDGNTCPDAKIIDGVAQVLSESSGTGDGRIYLIFFYAKDSKGAYCNGTVPVCVPHDQGKELNCELQANVLYNSTRYDSTDECP